MENKIYLGLDVSTNCVGVCLFLDDGSENGKILEITSVSPKIKKKEYNGIELLFKKAEVVSSFLMEKYSNTKIDYCVIEEPLLTSNNIYTCSTLLRFNTMIASFIYNKMGIVPEFISSYEARQYAFPELMSVRTHKKNGEKYETKKVVSDINHNKLVLFGSYPFDIDKKHVMMDLTNSIYTDIEWVYDKNRKFSQTNFDGNDSLICVLGSLHKRKYGDINPTVIKCSNDEKNNIKYSFEVFNGEMKFDKEIMSLQ
jgi:hypothetical protein